MILEPCCAVFHSRFYSSVCWYSPGESFNDMFYTYHLKDVNNHNTFFGTDSHLQSISMQQRHNIIQYFSLKLSKIPGLPV